MHLRSGLAAFALAILLARPLAAQQAEPRVWDAGARAWVGVGAMADALARYDVVFVGEQHDDPATHRFEAVLLDSVGQRAGHVLLSLEMFERDVQPLLDDHAIGRVTDSVFLARSRPWPNYAGDYRPLVRAAAARRWPIVAANVPRPLASAVSRGGWAALDTLPDPHRRWYAAQRQCAPEGEYFRRFGEAMGGAPSHGGQADTAAASAMLVRFYQAQCLKDETMAESIDRARQAWPGWKVIHYNGAFHSDHRLGTVERLARRLPSARIAVVAVVPVPDVTAADPAEHAGRGDYLVFVPAPTEAAPAEASQ
ncbi:ChaN family lipoprotein [Longimicrobium sp.]|uniref:ChaN family lipoprotein n=1 Tax=Longimicrobium sp. TaxID=2029185 RepID=UPI002E347992|nr:ChaN family lipoprotein [Longimicrobium sp.]HEX6040712.1 ChaN family lipoprotein [Longimicrobium sp.]